MMEAEQFSKTLVFIPSLVRLMVRQNFNAFIGRWNFKNSKTFSCEPEYITWLQTDCMVSWMLGWRFFSEYRILWKIFSYYKWREMAHTVDNNCSDEQNIAIMVSFVYTNLTSPSYNHAAVRLACTNVPNAWYSLLDGASDDGQIVRPKHVEHNKEK